LGGVGQTGALLVAGSAAVIGVAHSLLPDHWLPYLVLSKTGSWSAPRTLASVAAGAAAHLLSTVALGLVIATIGAGAIGWAGRTAELGGTLILTGFGAYLLRRGLVRLRGRRPDHVFLRPRAARGHLLQGAVLGLRPCVHAVPVFIAASAFGPAPCLAAVAAWAAATLGGMAGIVWLSLLGLRGAALEGVARHGDLVAGILISVMGLAAGLAGLEP